MSTIHQIYCTHCTHGSSALERREGELAPRMLGYSARAGSMESHELRRYYRQIERYASYYLPRDTPGEEKLRLVAATAPRRLVFVPSTGGLQLVAQVCYRQTDTEGRPGSYFAHVVFEEEKTAAARWSPLEALRLWSAAGWVTEDSPGLPFLLPPLGSLAQLQAGRRPAVDDGVLWSFLTTPAKGTFDDPAGLIPPRWRQMAPKERCGLFLDAFRGLLTVDAERHRSLLMVAEPSMAAVIFYGIVRLLPPGVRETVSFSTYEPNTERVGVTLAATVFFDPARSDLRPDAYRGHGFALNTFSGRRTDNRSHGPYAHDVVHRLLQEGWPSVDRTLDDLAAAGVQRLEDLDALAAVDRLVPVLFDPRQPLPADDWRRWPAAFNYLRRTLARTLAKGSPEGRLAPLVGRPAHLLLLELLLTGPELPGTREAIEYLLAAFPADRMAEFVPLVTALIEAYREKRVARATVARIVGRMSDADLLALFHAQGTAFFREYPHDEPALGQRLLAILLAIPKHVDQFRARLDLVLAGAHLLPDDDHRAIAEAWAACRTAIVEIGRLQDQRQGLLRRRRPVAQVEAACQRMAESIVRAWPGDASGDDAKGSAKQDCLRRIGRQMLDGKTLLPREVWQYEALWQKVAWRFEKGKWPTVSLEELRAKRRSSRVLWIALGIAAGLLLAVSLVLALRSSTPPTQVARRPAPAVRPQPKPSVVEKPKPVPEVRPEREPAPPKREDEKREEEKEEPNPPPLDEEAARIDAALEAVRAEKMQPPPEPPRSEEDPWKLRAEALARAMAGAFFDNAPLIEGWMDVPPHAIPPIVDPPQVYLGEGRLVVDGAVYGFGEGFERAAPVTRHELPQLASDVGLPSVGVALRAEPSGGYRIEVVGEPRPVQRETEAQKKERIAEIEKRMNMIRARLTIYRSRTASQEKKDAAPEELIELAGIQFKPALPRPNPRDPEFEDDLEAYRKAEQAYRAVIKENQRIRREADQVALQKLDAMARQIEEVTTSKAEVEEDEAGRRALEQFRNRCRALSVIVYQTPARPTEAERPAAGRLPTIKGEFNEQQGMALGLKPESMAQVRPAVVGSPNRLLSSEYSRHFIAGCLIVAQGKDGFVHRKELGDVTVEREYEILKGVTSVRVQFRFFLKAADPFAAEREPVAESAWHVIEPVEEGRQYTVRFELGKEGLEMLRGRSGPGAP